MDGPIWKPSTDRVATANVTRFANRAALRFGLSLNSFDELWHWSVAKPDDFWSFFFKESGLGPEPPSGAIGKGCEMFPRPEWFPGVTLNYAEALLAAGVATDQAVVSYTEAGLVRSVSFGELRYEVAALAAHFRRLGVRPGDRVAGYLPNVPEAIIGMLAAASLGALWTSCSPDFGGEATIERFGQVSPKVLIASENYVYGGKQFDLRERVAALIKQLPSLAGVVLVGTDLPRAAAGVDVRSYAAVLKEQPEPLSFTQLPFDHPLYIVYSSGTTGPPKSIVHGAGGTLVQHLKELVLHTDLKPNERILFFTTCGWMMWNWVVSALAARATVVLYDGFPLADDGTALLRLAERERLNVLGAGAKYFLALEKSGIRGRDRFDLSSLHTILSTGSPLPAASYHYIYDAVHDDVCVASISGGTDLISCFALGAPVLPVYPGQLQTRGLGMAVDVYAGDGTPLVGEPGELVCTVPFPSMPLFFWNDPQGEKYYESYFDMYPGIWRHGDWAELTPVGGMIIYGRSDATLNPGGVRIGTAEIYRQVETFPQVLEALAVSQEWYDDVRIILFLRLRDGDELTPELQGAIRLNLRTSCSPRHVPAKIIAVPDIPRTLNGKIVELAVREVIHSRPVRNMESLANPQALDYFRGLSELSAP